MGEDSHKLDIISDSNNSCWSRMYVFLFALIVVVAAAKPPSCNPKTEGLYNHINKIAARDVSKRDGWDNVAYPLNDIRQNATPKAKKIFWCPIVTKYAQRVADRCNLNESNTAIGYPGYIGGVINSEVDFSAAAKLVLTGRGGKRWCGIGREKKSCDLTLKHNPFNMIGCGFKNCNGKTNVVCYFA